MTDVVRIVVTDHDGSRETRRQVFASRQDAARVCRVRGWVSPAEESALVTDGKVDIHFAVRYRRIELKET